MATNITREILVSLLDYDADTGVFRWKLSVKPCGHRKPGAIAGGLMTTGYWKIGINYRLHAAHRLAWLYVYGKLPTTDIDHIDGDKTNNRIANLREVTESENGQNMRLSKANKTGHKNVWFDTRAQRYVAYLTIRGRRITLGTFVSLAEAASVAREGRAKYFTHDGSAP